VRNAAGVARVYLPREDDRPKNSNPRKNLRQRIRDLRQLFYRSKKEGVPSSTESGDRFSPELAVGAYHPLKTVEAFFFLLSPVKTTQFLPHKYRSAEKNILWAKRPRRIGGVTWENPTEESFICCTTLRWNRHCPVKKESGLKKEVRPKHQNPLIRSLKLRK